MKRIVEWTFGPHSAFRNLDTNIHRSKIVACAVFLGFALVSCIAPAQQTYIAGEPVWCRDFFGYNVTTEPNYRLRDVGRAYMSNTGPVIELNPQVLSGLPGYIQLFWYGHECGHHVLGHIAGVSRNSESNADCWCAPLN